MRANVVYCFKIGSEPKDEQESTKKYWQREIQPGVKEDIRRFFSPFTRNRIKETKHDLPQDPFVSLDEIALEKPESWGSDCGRAQGEDGKTTTHYFRKVSQFRFNSLEETQAQLDKLIGGTTNADSPRYKSWVILSDFLSKINSGDVTGAVEVLNQANTAELMPILADDENQVIDKGYFFEALDTITTRLRREQTLPEQGMTEIKRAMGRILDQQYQSPNFIEFLDELFAESPNTSKLYKLVNEIDPRETIKFFRNNYNLPGDANGVSNSIGAQVSRASSPVWDEIKNPGYETIASIADDLTEKLRMRALELESPELKNLISTIESSETDEDAIVAAANHVNPDHELSFQLFTFNYATGNKTFDPRKVFAYPGTTPLGIVTGAFLDDKLSADNYLKIVSDFAIRSSNRQELMDGFERVNVGKEKDEKSGYGVNVEGSALGMLASRYVENLFSGNTANNIKLMDVMRTMVVKHGARIEESRLGCNLYASTFNTDDDTLGAFVEQIFETFKTFDPGLEERLEELERKYEALKS